MYGPGAAMAPLSHLPHFGSPRAQQVSLNALCRSLIGEYCYGSRDRNATGQACCELLCKYSGAL